MATMEDIEREFQELQETSFYPGSRQPIRHANRPDGSTIHTGGWDSHPKIKMVNGVETEFFTIGDLAQALGRKPVTMRLWEREGTIPKSRFSQPSEDPRGRRRLYTREQVEGLVRIAQEEGVLISHVKPLRATRFTERATRLFAEAKIPGQA